MEEGAFKNKSCSTSYTTASPQVGITTFSLSALPTPPRKEMRVNKTYNGKAQGWVPRGHKGEPNSFFALKKS